MKSLATFEEKPDPYIYCIKLRITRETHMNRMEVNPLKPEKHQNHISKIDHSSYKTPCLHYKVKSICRFLNLWKEA
jgi:hypothetical protein